MIWGLSMQSIVSKGKDINEAIHLGLNLLEVSKKDVDIEIIQYEKKGFLGIKSKEAIVKLTKRNTESISPNQKQIVEEQDIFEKAEIFITELNDKETLPIEENLVREDPIGDMDSTTLLGKVWVKDGKLDCRPSPTHFPMVTIPKEIKLYKNNHLIKEETIIISNEDFYEIKVEQEEKATKWTVTMDEQKLKVSLYIEPGYKLNRTVEDIELDHHIELRTVVSQTNHNTLKYEEVIKKLEELRVKHGFNQDEILRAIEATEPGKFEIVTGIQPKPGKDGWVELFVDLGTREGPKEKQDGRVDFREIKQNPTVERGKVIGVIHPPVPGKIGYTVTNEPLPAPQTFPITIKLMKGVVVVDEKLVSTESGRPQMEKRGQLVKVGVMQKLTQKGDVDLSSGNIRFMGDVEIQGEVGDNMVVEAAGDIFVQRTVNMAKLVASGAIVTNGNILGSEISAGKNNMLIVELGHSLGIMHQHIENMVGVIKQLMLSPAFKSSDFSNAGLQPLVRILLEKKFNHFPPIAKKYVEIVRRGETYIDDEQWKEVALTLTKMFLTLTNEIVSLERISELSQKMKQLHQLSQTPVEPDSYITVPDVLNSKIYCSGDVTIIGKGCVNSKIHAGGILKINGIIRGGEVYGRLGVEINEVGAISGTATTVSAQADQKIIINKAMEGTTIKFGNVKYTFKETRHHIIAHLDQDQKIVFK
jgi:uncharacterized protein (DUF342 family)